MISSLNLRALTAALVVLCMAFAPALGDDLTVPPEFRGTAPVAGPQPLPTTPPKVPRIKKEKQASKTKEKASDVVKQLVEEPAASGTHVVSSKMPSQDDPLSVGMKWNADTMPSSASPSNLFSDYNRNVQGQSTGTGGQVGVKYKF